MLVNVRKYKQSIKEKAQNLYRERRTFKRAEKSTCIDIWGKTGAGRQ